MKAKLTLAALLTLACLGRAFAQQQVPAPQNVYARQGISLNGDWNYFADVQEQGDEQIKVNANAPSTYSASGTKARKHRTSNC